MMAKFFLVGLLLCEGFEVWLFGPQVVKSSRRKMTTRLISAKSEVSYYDMSKFRNEHNVKMQPGTASLIPIV